MSDPILASVFCDNHCDMLAEDTQHNSDLNGAVPLTAELHQCARTSRTAFQCMFQCLSMTPATPATIPHTRSVRVRVLCSSAASLQAYVALRYFATAGQQDLVGDTIHIHKRDKQASRGLFVDITFTS